MRRNTVKERPPVMSDLNAVQLFQFLVNNYNDRLGYLKHLYQTGEIGYNLYRETELLIRGYQYDNNKQ